jgi:hypothetical protein
MIVRGRRTRPIGVLSAVALSAVACGEAQEWAFVEQQDVRVRPVLQAVAETAAVATVVERSVTDLDAVVGGALDAVDPVMEWVSARRESARRGERWIYGPFEDPAGRALTWTVELTPLTSGSRFAFHVGARGDATGVPLLEGDVIEGDEGREGVVVVYADTLRRFGAELLDPRITVAGRVHARFRRSETEREVEIGFDEFWVATFGHAPWGSSGAFVLRTDAEGSGVVELDVERDRDDALFEDPPVHHLSTKMVWRTDGGRRIRAVAPAELQDPAGLPLGDLVVDECFDATGGLVYADVNEPYRDVLSGIRVGDRARCAFADDTLGE